MRAAMLPHALIMFVMMVMVKLYHTNCSTDVSSGLGNGRLLLRSKKTWFQCGSVGSLAFKFLTSASQHS